MRIPLTTQNRRKLSAIEPDPIRDVFVWDTEIKGFGYKVTPKEKRVWVLQYRNADGRSRRMTIGSAADLTADEARTRAARYKLFVLDGKDPLDDRRRLRQADPPSVAELAERYLKDHANIHKKPRSAAEDKRIIEAYIKPALGGLRVDRVSRRDVQRLHREMHSKPYMANRVWAVLSKMFNLAEGWGLRPELSNPCRGITRYKERSRVRYLTADELLRLGTALAEAPSDPDPEKRVSPVVTLAVRLLVLTGCRKSEILNLTWDQVDLEHGALRFSDSKTGPKTVPLGAPVVELFASAPRYEGNPFVLPGHVHGRPLTDLRPGWDRLIKRAEISDLRPHDLRHAFASVAAVAGESLLVIGALLGHTETETTRKYAHLTVDPVRDAADRTAEQIANALNMRSETEATPSSSIVQFKRKR